MNATGHRTRLICSLSSPSFRQVREGMLAAQIKGADMAEVRLDLLRPLPDANTIRDLLASAPLETIATLRPKRQGGAYEGDESTRLALLQAAADVATYVDVEDDVPLSQWPRGRVIVSHHDFASNAPDLERLVKTLCETPAEVVKIAFTANSPVDAMRALDVLHHANKPMISIAMGEAGVLSRLTCAKFNAFGTFASMDRESGTAPGQPTIEEFLNLYRWRRITPKTELYGVIACPVAHSMSPAIHNAAFDSCSYDGLYIPCLVEPPAESFDAFMDAAISRPHLDWRGFSVTIPHKKHAIDYVGAKNCDDLSVQIGAVNTIVLAPGKPPRGVNTDYAAAVDSLCKAMGIERADLAGMKISVLGAGGVARAVVAALAHHGANITIHNRTTQRAKELAEEFACSWGELAYAHNTPADVVINCTSAGMHPNLESSPLDSIPTGAKVVFDTIYNPIETKLLVQGAARGTRTVSGLEMFVRQAAEQFEAWTQTPAPLDVMRNVILKRLSPD